jgi:LmbE family N-acetylglucosaminyl deacetylase
MISRLYLALLLIALCMPLSVRAEVSMAQIYICAHPDDCVLFMNPDLYRDISSNRNKTVIIYITSGDAGEKWKNSETSYPYVREQASLLATDWMSAIERTTPQASRQVSRQRIRGHVIRRVQSAQTVSYFMRLPDGNMYGDGFERYQFKSLQNLKEGAISTIHAIDGTAHYNGWQELVATVGAILEQEIGDHTQISLHIADTNTISNHDDHSDHQHAAQAINEWLEHAPQSGRCFKIYEHLDYAIADLPQNLDVVALRNNSGSFAVLTAYQQLKMGYHHWNEAHARYLGRDYVTTRTIPDDCTW